MRKFVVLLALAVSAPMAASAAPVETLSLNHRDISVIDGDSIQAGGRVLHLQGIDAPELGQACDNGGHYWLCGLSAAYELRRLVGFQMTPIQCDQENTGSARESVALCMANGDDIGLTLISSGLAVAAPDSPLHYRVAERHARQASLGIWGGKFVNPADWRRDERLPGEHEFTVSSHLHGDLPWKIEGGGLTFDPRAQHAACLVKGVIEDGRRIYYGPLDKGYDTLRLNTGRGERLFCGDDLARTAGWRHKGESSRVN